MAAAAVIFLLLLFPLLFFNPTLSIPDQTALLNFKKSLAHSDLLGSWVESTSPCDKNAGWSGVTCGNGVVIGLRLSNSDLSGTLDVDSLDQMQSLRTLNFVNNSFTGPIPDFNRLGALKALFLNGNKLSGEINDSYFAPMASLKKLWLSDNQFSGPIPTSLQKLPRLKELHLENNNFSGTIPALSQPSIDALNMSNNALEGEIPTAMRRFPASSFQGNPGLCGEQLGKACDAENETSNAAITATSTPTGVPLTPSGSNSGTLHSKIVMIMAAVVVAILAGYGFVAMTKEKKKRNDFMILKRRDTMRGDEAVEVCISGSSGGMTGRGADSSRKKKAAGGESNGRKGGSAANKGGKNAMGDLLIINDKKGNFGMSDLMKAAAEVLGNGSLGSAYKAVMGNGVSVVVKRLREMNRLGKDGLEAQIRRLGMLRHRNILTPLGYHYRKEEKLLVSEYIPKGSLLYVLHGDRGPRHEELTWAIRVKIAQGVARGMGYLHSEFPSHELPHGNLKSSNVLLDSDYEPLLSDYAFYPLINPAQATQTMFACKSPEGVRGEAVSPRSDVYCLGVVVLELVTGKFPSQYLSNGKGGTDVVQWAHSAVSENKVTEFIDPDLLTSTPPESADQMEALLHIGAACTESDPETRLDMKEAIRRIEEIRAA